MFPLASSRSAGTSSRVGRQGAGAQGIGSDFAGLPQLEACTERLLAALVKALGAMAGSTTGVDGTVVGFRRLALADHLAAHRPGAVAAALDCTGVACTILVTQDAALVHTLIELLCGGDGGECRIDEMRPATAIDAQYAHTIATLTAGAIAGEWKERGFVAAKPVRVEGAPAPDVCGARIREVGVVTLALSIFGVRGLLTLGLPTAALAAFGDEAGKTAVPVEALAAAEADWTRRLGREVGLAAVRVDVMLDALPLSLRQLSQLAPGQVIALPGDARSRAALICDGRTLFRGEIGQDDERYSLRIDAAARASIPPTRNPLDLPLEA